MNTKTHDKKIVLAFSGGLDTSFSVPYLLDKGYEVLTVTVNTGGFSPNELAAIASKSKKLGASRHYEIDGQETLFDEVASYLVQAHSMYEGSYPNLCADRYIIAQETLAVAKKEQAEYVAHGSSAMGNDQVRFDVALMTINPDISIICPIKETGGNRKEEQMYLEKKGFSVSSLHKKYSINQNLLGVTYSGSEIDDLKEPDESMFLFTHVKEKIPKYIDIGFEHGVPISINGKSYSGGALLEKLNHIAGSYGIGRGYYTGDCVIGIKGHIVFEAPGLFCLMTAHRALEQLVLTKSQQELSVTMSHQFTDLLYTGKFFEPAVSDLKAFFDHQQKHVAGVVRLKMTTNACYPVSVLSPHSLINTNIAGYAQHCSWTAEDAHGFIKLFGLQGKIANQAQKKGTHI